jgi:isoleucyl-tRNA synthetase
VRFEPARGGKCERCWRVLPEVNTRTSHLCNRCTDAVRKVPA